MSLSGLQWDRESLLLPGYDPYATGGACLFDPKRASSAVRFFEEHLKHVEGAMAGKPFALEKWQRAMIANLFGWRKRDEFGRDVRRYREVMLFVARKNGKTPLAAGICLLVLFFDGEAGAQIYSAAAEREQAALLFRHARGMVEQSPMLLSRADIFKGVGHRSIGLKSDPASVYKVLTADAETKHGGNTHLALIDELHAQPNRDLVDVMQTSMASANRKQPLLIHITTAGYDRHSICYEKYDYACKVRDGIIDDPSFLPVIYEAGADSDWTDETVWEKANPNLDVSVSREYLRRECKRAKESPAYENTFKRLHLNLWTEQDVRWLNMERWDLCAGLQENETPVRWRERMLEELRGRECWAGLDLASTTDVAALSLLFPDDDGYIVLPFFWIPGENARARQNRDRVPYVTWEREGWLTMTDGDSIDHEAIRQTVNELGTQYELKQIQVDRWNATHLVTQLQGDGFSVELFGQGFQSMSAPTKELEVLMLAERLRHGGNPVLRWMAGNVSIKQDAAGNMKPDKEKSTEKIDGIVATVMALGGAMEREEGECRFITL